MGRKTIELIVDDLDGEELNEGEGQTVTFGYQGVEYFIDLSDKNAKKLDDVLAPYVGVATRVSGNRGRGTRTTTTGPRSRRQELQTMRTWARDHGYQVSDR